MKERLTGAIIVVALIVLLVPEMLTGPRRAALPRSAAGASDEPPMRSYTITLAEDAHSRSGNPNAAVTPQSNSTDTSNTQPSTAQGTAADSNAAATAGPAAPERASGTTSGSERVAQAGGTSAPGAPAAATEAPAAASPAPPAGSASGSAPRTPASTATSPRARGAARTPAQTEAAPATSGGKSGGQERGHWLVQLGVFSSRQRADELAERYRAKGFHASAAPVPGHKLFRVRVGPAADRAEAVALQKRLRAAGSTGTALVPSS